MTEALLRDHRVLVVEDEYLVAQAVSRGLRRAGATVLGPVANVEAALTLLAGEAAIDAAVLEVNLGEQKVYPVLDRPLARGARCVFATGNDPADVPPTYAAVARCEKPVDPSCLVRALADAAAPKRGDRPGGADPLREMRDQLTRQMRIAEDAGQTLLAAKLCEAPEVVIDALRD